MADDRDILRDLARRVREIADDPDMARRRDLWRRHNALEGERPLVLCFPEGAWGELLPKESLLCRDARSRAWEWTLRSRVYWWDHLRDDNFVDPWFDIGWHVRSSGMGFDIPYTYGDSRGSYVWDAPIKNLDRDLSRLRPRTHTVDRAATLSEVEQAREIFGDILPVRIRSFLWWTVGLTWEAAKLIGLENLMWAMCDQPAQLHRLMAFLRDDMLAYITWCEREGLLSGNDGADYVGSGGVGAVEGLREPGRGDDPATLRERWGFGESQETVGVSPDMFEEFILPYQVPLLDRFGLNCYGCCEGLEHRIEKVIAHVPRLRRVSVAPSANQEVLASRLGKRFIFSRKPFPAHVCIDFNERAIREDLGTTLRLADGCPLELVMKDTHTLQGDATRLGRWVRIAYEEIDRHLAAG